MRSPTLQDKTAAARTGAYHGAEAVACVRTVEHEFHTLRKRAGVYEATWSAKIVCTGPDRTQWLNGMVTNNVRDLAQGTGVYAFVLNAQGRPQGDLTVHHRGDHFLLTTGEDQVQKLTDWLNHYIIMDDVELTNITPRLVTLCVAGPESASVLERAGMPRPQALLETNDAVWNNLGISVTRGMHEHFLSYEIWLAPENVAAVWKALLSAGAESVGYEALELIRIANGAPAYGQDIRERDLPQETGQAHALHFSKGCYLGQEIVERIHSRAILHRAFAGFVLSRVAKPGTKLQWEGKNGGELTSVAELPIPDGQRIVALGYVRPEASAPGTLLTSEDVTATVRALPFEF